MNTTLRIMASVLAASLVMTGCSTSGGVTSDPYYGKSSRKHYGKANKINLFRRNKDKSTASSVPSASDPEYQEYLDWKKWQEFREYQEWKKNNPAPGQSDSSASS